MINSTNGLFNSDVSKHNIEIKEQQLFNAIEMAVFRVFMEAF